MSELEKEFVIDESNCKSCPLWETSYSGPVRRSGVYGRGNGSSGLWFYGESLRERDINLGSPFVGDGGQLLKTLLKEVGISEEDAWITSSVRCRTPKDRLPKAPEIKICTETHALKDVPEKAPKLIVTLGNVALKAILNLQKITDNRGQFFDSELFNCKVLPTFHPNSIISDPKKYDTLRQDLVKAREYVNDISEKPPKLHRELINSKESFMRCMAVLSSPVVKERYCDIETTGLEFYSKEIASVSFTTQIEGEYYAFAFLTLPKDGWWSADLDDPEIHQALQQVLALPTDFHNGLFDVKFFWIRNFIVNFGGDTIDQHLLIDENSPHNMKYLISIYNKFGNLQGKTAFAEDAEFQDLADHEFYKAPPELLLDINIDDTYHGLLLKQKFTPMLEKEGLTTFYNKVQMPFKRVLTKMSYRGIKMDRQGIIDLSEKYRANILEKEVELFDSVGKKFKYGAGTKELGYILYSDLSLPILKRTEKTGQPSTDKETLDELAEIHPVPKLIKELRFFKGMLQKYLDGNDLSENPKPGLGMLCCLDKNDRIHGNFLSFGTISGRPSCTKPNLLNIPKNPEIRQLFITEEGWSLIELDYSQAELVLLAHLSGDPDFIRDVSSTDFHMATAKTLMKQEVVDDVIRRKAKAINFLKSYGGGKKKLARDLKITEGEAEHWLNKWDDSYPLVPLYKNAQQRLWRDQGYIEGIYGRKKRFPPALTNEIEGYYDRISVNFMCQNGVGDAINSALVDIDFLLDKLFGWHPQTIHQVPGIVLTVYDSILIEAPDWIVAEIKEVALEIMGIPLPKLGVSLKTDVTISKRWGEKLEKPADVTELQEPEEL